MNSTFEFAKWFWRYTRPYLSWVILAIVGIFVYSITNTAAVIYAFHELASQIEAGTLSEGLSITIPEIPLIFPSGGEWVVASGTPFEILNTLILYGIVIMAVRIVADFVRLFTMSYVATAIAKDLRSELYENILRRPVTFFEQRNVGDLMSRLSNDVDQVKDAVNIGFRDLIMAPLELIAAVGLVIFFAPYLSLAYLIIPVAGFVIYLVGKRIKRYSRASQDVMGRLHTLIQERFSGIKLVKSVGREDEEINMFDDLNSKHFRKNVRKLLSDSLLKPGIHSLILFPSLGVLYVAVSFVIQGYLTVTSILTFLISLTYVYKSLRKLAAVNDKLQTCRGAAERIHEIYQEKQDYNLNLDDGTQQPEFNENLVFDSVYYRYPEYDEYALRNVNFTFERGKNVALVGPSGAGKSTFIDLFMRFMDPTEGTISLDGKPLSEYDLSSYRRLFGLVTQHPILFDDSISQNIRYGRDDIEDEQIRKVASQAEALDFIEDLPNGFDTMVGEEGVKLSGGEKQRITLARALASEPKILVLDEATSDVDSRSEKKIIKAIKNLPHDITLLTISHALATVQFAEEIVVLNNHEIEAIGSHEELVKDSPTYQELYQHQVDELKT